MCPIWVRLIPVTFPQVKQPTGYNQKDNVKRNYLTFWLKLKIEKLIFVGSKLRVACQNGILVFFFRSLTISIFLPVRTFPTWNLLRQEEEKSVHSHVSLPTRAISQMWEILGGCHCVRKIEIVRERKKKTKISFWQATRNSWHSWLVPEGWTAMTLKLRSSRERFLKFSFGAVFEPFYWFF